EVSIHRQETPRSRDPRSTLLLTEPLGGTPEAQGGVPDEVDLLTVHPVPARPEPAGIIAFGQGAEVAVTVADPLDLGTSHLPGAIGDAEPALGRPVDQVRGGREVRGELGMVRDRGDRGGSAAIAEPADQRVDRRVLAELADAGRQDDQLAVV